MSGVSASAALLDAAMATLAVAGLFTLLLLVKSTLHYTRGGPRLRGEILQHYFGYTLASVLRLALNAFLLASLLAWAGALWHAALVAAGLVPAPFSMGLLAALLGLWAMTDIACTGRRASTLGTDPSGDMRNSHAPNFSTCSAQAKWASGTARRRTPALWMSDSVVYRSSG